MGSVTCVYLVLQGHPSTWYQEALGSISGMKVCEWEFLTIVQVRSGLPRAGVQGQRLPTGWGREGEGGNGFCRGGRDEAAADLLSLGCPPGPRKLQVWAPWDATSKGWVPQGKPDPAFKGNAGTWGAGVWVEFEATVQNKCTVLVRPKEAVDSEVKVKGDLHKRGFLVLDRGVDWSRGGRLASVDKPSAAGGGRLGPGEPAEPAPACGDLRRVLCSSQSPRL